MGEHTFTILEYAGMPNLALDTRRECGVVLFGNFLDGAKDVVRPMKRKGNFHVSNGLNASRPGVGLKTWVPHENVEDFECNPPSDADCCPLLFYSLTSQR